MTGICAWAPCGADMSLKDFRARYCSTKCSRAAAWSSRPKHGKPGPKPAEYRVGAQRSSGAGWLHFGRDAVEVYGTVEDLLDAHAPGWRERAALRAKEAA